MRKHRLSIQVVRRGAALDGIQVVSSAHDSGAVVISKHHSVYAADHGRSIVIANDRAPVMDDTDRPLDGRPGKVGG
jgi:hypothetical protein